jgi:PadR family transcriptional regulator, regulatory protein PadR
VYLGKRVRKYYKITASGKEEIIKITDELNDFINTLQIIFNTKIA